MFNARVERERDFCPRQSRRGREKKKFVYREGLIGGVEFFRRDSFASYRLGKIVSIDGTAISGHSTLFPRNSCENSFVIRRPAY